MSMAARREPAVRPIGRNGTDGKTAMIQKTANAMDPKTTFSVDAIAISDRRRHRISLITFVEKMMKPKLNFFFARNGIKQ